LRYSIANRNDLHKASNRRDIYSSKGMNGRITIVGGNEVYHGAPALASNSAYMVLAALRIGVGYVTEFVPKQNLVETRAISPNIIVRPLKGRHLTPSDISVINESIDHSECLVIGPGIGLEKETMKAAIKLFDYARKKSKKVVIDAGSIHTLNNRIKLDRNFVITPNSGESELLLNNKLDDRNLSKRIKAALKISDIYNVNVILKGHDSVITDGNRVKVVKSKSAALGVMGSGDVLAGMVGGYAAKNSDMFVAAVAAEYLHSTIGDILYKKMGNHILPTDVIDYIPKVLKNLD